MKKIGILGSGIVAKTLATGFVKHGYEVMLGTRNPNKLDSWDSQSRVGVTIGSFKEAAGFADAIVLAVKGTVAELVLEMAGEENINGKLVMDATNPIEEAPPENGVLRFFTNHTESLMEKLQKRFDKAHFVKVFNCVGNAYMVNPDFGGVKPSMFIAGNNTESKLQVQIILELFGWETEDMGGMESARAIEPLCMLWCIPGFLNNNWNHAFKLLKK